MIDHDWYALVTFGRYAPDVPNPPHGPWQGRDAAQRAWDHWYHRTGPEAGRCADVTQAKIVGPFCTREQARRADISDWDRLICQHQHADA